MRAKVGDQIISLQRESDHVPGDIFIIRKVVQDEPSSNFCRVLMDMIAGPSYVNGKIFRPQSPTSLLDGYFALHVPHLTDDELKSAVSLPRHEDLENFMFGQ